RFSRDWSSDVCSSDLLILVPLAVERPIFAGDDEPRVRHGQATSRFHLYSSSIFRRRTEKHSRRPSWTGPRPADGAPASWLAEKRSGGEGLPRSAGEAEASGRTGANGRPEGMRRGPSARRGFEPARGRGCTEVGPRSNRASAEKSDRKS